MRWFGLKRRAQSAATTTLVRLKPSVDISFAALLYFGATLFIGLAATNSQTNLLFGVFGMMIGVLMVAGYISRLSLRRLEVRRIIPEHLVVGEKATLSYEIRNGKRYWPSVSVALGELDGCDAFRQQPYGYVLHIASGMNSTVMVPLMPRRRGIQQFFRYQVSTSFPFGFVKRALIGKQQDTVVVFPPLAMVDPAILLMCQSADNTGARMRPRKGGSDEFYGLKEYRQGENPRLIHWRASARRGETVMREMTRVSPPRLLLVVDTYRGADLSVRAEEVEKAIAMAASLASLALERGYPVGIAAWSGALVGAMPDRGKRHRREILTALARLQQNHECTVQEILEEVIPQVDAGTSIVIFTPRHQAAHARSRRRRRTVTISTQDPSLTSMFRFGEEVDFAAAAPLAGETKAKAAAQGAEEAARA